MRKSSNTRKTNETEIFIELNLDGKGERQISTGIKFFNHMLEQFAAHSLIDLKIDAKSLDGDPHHLVEDVAITLGLLLKEALGDKKGIKRYGSFLLPMDEALVLSVIDLSNRAFCKLDAVFDQEKTSDFEVVLIAHFFYSLAQNLGATVHIKVLDGADVHHIIEAIFKSFARALRMACEIDEKNSDNIPSTKGTL